MAAVQVAGSPSLGGSCGGASLSPSYLGTSSWLRLGLRSGGLRESSWLQTWPLVPSAASSSWDFGES